MNRPVVPPLATGTADVPEAVTPQGEPESDSPSFEELDYWERAELLRCGEREAI